MNRRRWSRWLCVSLLSAGIALSCTATPDMSDAVPALPGAFQPDGGGALVDEATACAELVGAENRVRAMLGCDAVMHECPSYIRPAGGADCFLYDQASLAGCAALYGSFTSCNQFEQRPCIVAAESNCEFFDSGTGAGGAGPSAIGAGGEGPGRGELGMGGASAADGANAADGGEVGVGGASAAGAGG